MKRNPPSTVEFSIGPHSARPGWEVARIVYDSSRPEHKRQVDAAITAMVKAHRFADPGAAPRTSARVIGTHLVEQKTMIEMQRTGAVLPTAVAPVRLETTAPSGHDVSTSGRSTFAGINVPPPAGLEKDPHASLFVMALARIARKAVEQGRVPTLAVGAKSSRNSKSAEKVQTALLQGGGDRRDSADSRTR